ncbi:MAG TPA: hypothetical protein VFM39_01080, partial [bacterium]|nr:hypothetical protein [bacterium]
MPPIQKGSLFAAGQAAGLGRSTPQDGIVKRTTTRQRGPHPASVMTIAPITTAILTKRIEARAYSSEVRAVSAVWTRTGMES